MCVHPCLFLFVSMCACMRRCLCAAHIVAVGPLCSGVGVRPALARAPWRRRAAGAVSHMGKAGRAPRVPLGAGGLGPWRAISARWRPGPVPPLLFSVACARSECRCRRAPLKAIAASLLSGIGGESRESVCECAPSPELKCRFAPTLAGFRGAGGIRGQYQHP